MSIIIRIMAFGVAFALLLACFRLAGAVTSWWWVAAPIPLGWLAGSLWLAVAMIRSKNHV